MTYELLCLFQLAKLISDDGPNPRASWSTFLNSVCHEVPSSQFRDWQRASFALAMRYLPEAPVTDPTPVPPPMSETQGLATQQNLPPPVPQQQYAPAATSTVTGPLWTGHQQGFAMTLPPLQQQPAITLAPYTAPTQAPAITLAPYTAPSQAPATSTGAYLTVSI